MTKLDALISERLGRLEQGADGQRIPWYAGSGADGVRSAAVVNRAKVVRAFDSRLCWTCGQRRGIYTSYVLDPYTAGTGVTELPGSHRGCARWAAVAFAGTVGAANPASARKSVNGAVVLCRDPGARLVWTTQRDSLEGRRVYLGAASAAAVSWYLVGEDIPAGQVPAAVLRLRERLDAAAEVDDDPAAARLDFKTQLDALARLLRQQWRTD